MFLSSGWIRECVGNPSIATLLTRVVFFSYLYSSRYTLRIASILAYIFFQNHNPKDHPWFCVARLHGWRHFSDKWTELKWKLAHEPKICLLHFLNQEKKFWSSYVFFAPVTLNSLFKKAKIMLMRTRLAKVGGAHAPLSSRTSSRDSYVVVWILQPLMYLEWISFLFRFTFLLAAPQISFDFWKC